MTLLTDLDDLSCECSAPGGTDEPSSAKAPNDEQAWRQRHAARMREYRQRTASDASRLHERDRKRAARAKESEEQKRMRKLKDRARWRERHTFLAPSVAGFLSTRTSGLLKGVKTADQLVTDVALRESVVARFIAKQAEVAKELADWTIAPTTTKQAREMMLKQVSWVKVCQVKRSFFGYIYTVVAIMMCLKCCLSLTFRPLAIDYKSYLYICLLVLILAMGCRAGRLCHVETTRGIAG